MVGWVVLSAIKCMRMQLHVCVFFSGLLNTAYIEMSLLNVSTADLHQDIHVIPPAEKR